MFTLLYVLKDMSLFIYFFGRKSQTLVFGSQMTFHMPRSLYDFWSAIFVRFHALVFETKPYEYRTEEIVGFPQYLSGNRTEPVDVRIMTTQCPYDLMVSYGHRAATV